MKMIKRKDQDSNIICERGDYFDNIYKNIEELEEIDLNKILRMLK